MLGFPGMRLVPARRSDVVRWLATSARLVLLAAAGSLAALYLTGFRYDALVPLASHRGFVPPQRPSGDGAIVYWAREQSVIAVPARPWRPRRIRMEVRAAPEAPPHGVALAVTLGDTTTKPIQVGHRWQEEIWDVGATPPDTDELVVTLAGDVWGAQKRGVGVRNVRVTSGVSLRGAVWAAATGIAWALGCAWLLGRRGPDEARRLGAGQRPVAIVFALTATLAVLLGAATFGLSTSARVAGWMLTRGLVEASNVVFLLALLVLPGWAVVLKAAAWRAEADPEHGALLSVGATLAMIGGLLTLLQITGAPPVVFTWVFVALYAASGLVVLGTVDARQKTERFIDAARAVFLLPLLVACAAIFYLSVGVDTLDDVVRWSHPARRHLFALQIDNHLSWLSSETWRRHLDANALHTVAIWRIGDRGPLYAAVHSFLTRALEPSPEYGWYLRLGILLNAFFSGAVFIVIRRLTGHRGTAWLCAALVAFNPWFFLNVYYTWPKLLGAHLALSAMLTLWREPVPRSSDYGIAGGFFGLAALAHPGTLISMPVFCLFTLFGSERSRQALGRWVAFAAAFGLVLAPWLTYKSWYAPETYNLFTTHYLDRKGFGQPVGANIQRFLEEHPWNEQLARRTSNLVDMWWRRIAWPPILGFWTGQPVGSRLATPEFFWPWHSAGILWFVLIPVGWLVARGRGLLGRTDSHRATTDIEDRPGFLTRVSILLALVAVSLSLNAVLRWQPSISHELPYFELTLLAACGLVLLRRQGRAFLALAGLAVLARQWSYFEQSARTSPLALPIMDVNGAMFWLTSVSAFAATAFIASESRTQPRQVPRS
jgi:hypothetical protein